MPKTYEVIKGNTSPLFKVGVEGESSLDANYECNITVQGTAVSRQVTDKSGDSRYFLVQLTPTETGGLKSGPNVLGVEIKNLTITPVPFVKEEHIKLEVIDQLVK